MSQEIYQKAVDLIEAKHYQEAYELLLTITAAHPQATPTITQLITDGLINPNRPDIPTAAFILPEKRRAIQQAETKNGGFSKSLKRALIFILLLIVCVLAILVALTVLGN